jgi:hypothetical protein
MPRIFGCLGAANLILLVSTALAGFLDPAPAADRHVLLAVFTLLLTCLVQVLAFTYLIVTGKVLAQAVHLGRLDTAAVNRAKELKRFATRTLACVVVGAVIVTATGAAAWRGGDPHLYHLPASIAFVGVLAWGLFRQYDLVCRNARLLEQTLASYSARKEHGKAR